LKPQRTIIMSSGENPAEKDDLLIAIELQIEYNREAELARLDRLELEDDWNLAHEIRESNRVNQQVPSVPAVHSDNNRPPVEDTTDDWDIAVNLHQQLNDGGQHTQSNRAESSQSNKEEEEDDTELAQAIAESKETARIIQQAQSVSAEYSCYCKECLYWRAKNQCGCFICKLKRTANIWRRK